MLSFYFYPALCCGTQVLKDPQPQGMQTPPDHFSMPATNKPWSCTNLQHPNMVSEASASHIPRVTRQLFGQTPGKHTVKCGHSCKQTNSSLIVEAAESASSVSTVQLYGRNQPTSPFKTPPAARELPQTTQWGQLSQRARERVTRAVMRS